MNLISQILVNNDCYKANQKMTPKGVMVHSTASNNTYISRYVQPDDGRIGTNKYNNHWNQPGVGACVHAFIGKLSNGEIASCQTLPWSMRGWHAGTGSSGKSANDGYISFEICEDDLTSKEYFDRVYREAVELTAYLCKTYNIAVSSDTVICHSEGYKKGIASNHADVMHWFPKHGKSMDTFRADVILEINKKPAETEGKIEASDYAKSAWAKLQRAEATDGSNPTGYLIRQDAAVILDRLGYLDIEISEEEIQEAVNSIRYK